MVCVDLKGKKKDWKKITKGIPLIFGAKLRTKKGNQFVITHPELLFSGRTNASVDTTCRIRVAADLGFLFKCLNVFCFNFIIELDIFCLQDCMHVRTRVCV